MFSAMQDSLNATKAEFEKKFEEKARAEKKVFSFDTEIAATVEENNIITEENNIQ